MDELSTRLDLTSLKRGVGSLAKAVAVVTEAEHRDDLSRDFRNVLRAGVIQNFEFTYELCWKFMKRWVEMNIGASYVDGVTRRHLFRYAAENRLIEDVEAWMGFHVARNKTSHTYGEVAADEVCSKALDFLPAAQSLLENIERNND